MSVSDGKRCDEDAKIMWLETIDLHIEGANKHMPSDCKIYLEVDVNQILATQHETTQKKSLSVVPFELVSDSFAAHLEEQLTLAIYLNSSGCFCTADSQEGCIQGLALALHQMEPFKASASKGEP
eukprot:2296783-Amphidinium_carterae.1